MVHHASAAGVLADAKRCLRLGSFVREIKIRRKIHRIMKLKATKAMPIVKKGVSEHEREKILR